MTTPAASSVRDTFGQNQLVRGLFYVYLVMWMAMAISPIDRMDWLLENLLVFAFSGALVSTYRNFQFSTFSYVLIFCFLGLHAMGAHYTYGQVPFGNWLKQEFRLDRNHFDRIAHFSFGLLVSYPMRELFARRLNVTGTWSYYLPIEMVLAFSAFFELLEAWIAKLVAPELANQYLASQGDPWDTQNDMAIALAGSCIAMAITALHDRFRSRTPIPQPSA
jgi:putative membrane protein